MDSIIDVVQKNWIKALAGLGPLHEVILQEPGAVLFGAAFLASRVAYGLRWRRSKGADIHQMLTPSILHDERILIVGDVHGCIDELKMIVREAHEMLPPDTIFHVVLVGDLVNKGPHSAEVIQYCREMGYSCVLGNHDVAAIKNFNSPVGKYSWIQTLSVEDKQWLYDLPYTLSIPQFNCVVVHAGLVPGISLEDQTEYNMIMMRNVSRITSSEPYGAHSTADIGQPWAEAWGKESIKCQYHLLKSKDRVPHIYFGHDAKRGLQQYEKATGLDTGVCYGRKLTGIILPERLLVQVNAKKVYQVPAVDSNEASKANNTSSSKPIAPGTPPRRTASRNTPLYNQRKSSSPSRHSPSRVTAPVRSPPRLVKVGSPPRFAKSLTSKISVSRPKI